MTLGQLRSMAEAAGVVKGKGYVKKQELIERLLTVEAAPAVPAQTTAPVDTPATTPAPAPTGKRGRPKRLAETSHSPNAVKEHAAHKPTQVSENQQPQSQNQQPQNQQPQPSEPQNQTQTQAQQSAVQSPSATAPNVSQQQATGRKKRRRIAADNDNANTARPEPNSLTTQIRWGQRRLPLRSRSAQALKKTAIVMCRRGKTVTEIAGAINRTQMADNP